MILLDGGRNALKMVYPITPKEGVGRSNRLGDANKIKGLQVLTASLFSLCRSKCRSKFCDHMIPVPHLIDVSRHYKCTGFSKKTHKNRVKNLFQRTVNKLS